MEYKTFYLYCKVVTFNLIFINLFLVHHHICTNTTTESLPEDSDSFGKRIGEEVLWEACSIYWRKKDPSQTNPEN